MEKVKSYWNERWAKVEPEVETKRCDYYISDYGRIKSIEKDTGNERIIKGGTVSKKNLKVLRLKLKGNIPYHTYVHKFVAAHFVENPENKTFVIHKDGDGSNNFYKNLQWMTQKEVTKLFVESGVYKRVKQTTMKNGSSVIKMTESKVRLLKKRLKEGKTKKKILAKSFGISYMQLNRIERGENWGHID